MSVKGWERRIWSCAEGVIYISTRVEIFQQWQHQCYHLLPCQSWRLTETMNKTHKLWSWLQYEPWYRVWLCPIQSVEEANSYSRADHIKSERTFWRNLRDSYLLLNRLCSMNFEMNPQFMLPLVGLTAYFAFERNCLFMGVHVLLQMIPGFKAFPTCGALKLPLLAMLLFMLF